MRIQQCAVTLAVVASALLPTQSAAQTVGFVYGLTRPNFSSVANSLYGAAVDATGQLIPLAGFPILTGGKGEAGSPERVFYDAAGGRLYALNNTSNTVSAWSVNIGVRPWVRVEDFGPAAGEINRGILESLRGCGIVLPFPQREVRLLGPADFDVPKRHEPTQDTVSSRE